MSRRLDCIIAARALVVAALAAAGHGAADVRGFEQEYMPPANGGSYGTVLGTVGAMDEPEVDLSPLNYHFTLPLMIDLIAPEGATDGAAKIDAMAQAIGAGVLANRTLGGLADWVDIGALDEDEEAPPNTPTVRWGRFPMMIEFTTAQPLG